MAHFHTKWFTALTFLSIKYMYLCIKVLDVNITPLLVKFRL